MYNEETDRIIYDFIEESGKVDGTDVQMLLGCSYAQALNILNLLTRKRMLTSTTEGGKKYFMINPCGSLATKTQNDNSVPARVSRSSKHAIMR